jgi:uncharacterized protein (DUF305 family)
VRWGALAVAVAFLVGAIGYLIGVRTTEPDAPSEVDEGFVADMASHHDQAVAMALIAQERSEDPIVRSFASEVVLFQRYEMGRFRSIQERWGVRQPDYDPDRTTMAWMAMPTPLSAMPGMASAEDLDRLQDETGAAFDLLFLDLMSEHHRGGAHMSEDAATRASDPEVRDLAGVMARNQLAELGEYEAQAERIRASMG